LAAWAPSHGVWRQTRRPLQPARTLLPPTASSTYHMSGDIRQSTNPPCSTAAAAAAPRFLTTRVAVSNSDATIRTFPIAYAFRADRSTLAPPDAAKYCCRMYCADEDSCNAINTRSRAAGGVKAQNAAAFAKARRENSGDPGEKKPRRVRTMGAPLTGASGSGSAVETETGASGAPMTPRRRRRSERRKDPSPPPAINGARVRWPRTHCPNPSRRPESSANVSSSATSGPSMSGARTSPASRRLPEWVTSGSGAYWASFSGGATSSAAAVLRLRGSSSDFPRDLPGERPRTTSPLSAEKKPCLLSFSIASGSSEEMAIN
jgi:hypothetical protein